MKSFSNIIVEKVFYHKNVSNRMRYVPEYSNLRKVSYLRHFYFILVLETVQEIFNYALNLPNNNPVDAP